MLPLPSLDGSNFNSESVPLLSTRMSCSNDRCPYPGFRGCIELPQQAQAEKRIEVEVGRVPNRQSNERYRIIASM